MKGDEERLRVGCCGTWHYIRVSPSGPFVLEDHRDPKEMENELALAALDRRAACNCVQCLLWWREWLARDVEAGGLEWSGTPFRRLGQNAQWAMERIHERRGFQQGQRDPVWGTEERGLRAVFLFQRAAARWFQKTSYRSGWLHHGHGGFYEGRSSLTDRALWFSYTLFGASRSAYANLKEMVDIEIDAVRYMLLRRTLRIGAVNGGAVLLLGLRERLGPSKAVVDCVTGLDYDPNRGLEPHVGIATIRRLRGNAWGTKDVF